MRNETITPAPNLATSITDGELLERWRSGDRPAGAALVQRHTATLQRFFSARLAQDADDLVQQTIVACVEARDRFRGDSDFRSYLLSIARFQLYKHYRFIRKRGPLDDRTGTVPDVATLTTAPESKWVHEFLLLRALHSIPRDMQIVIELAYWRGESVVQIARTLGVPPNTVYSRIRRAKRQLRDAMES